MGGEGKVGNALCPWEVLARTRLMAKHIWCGRTERGCGLEVEAVVEGEMGWAGGENTGRGKVLVEEGGDRVGEARLRGV